jgi:alkanesulfonate monooxygenase SsuD/methylene tetrahydromethanopterin reductase-like flavin-dependent oxidoreductase (luciferase family)
VWYGGFFTPRLIRRVVELGDGWLLYGGLGMSLEQKADAIAELKEQFAAAGRDPAALGICDMVTPLDGDIARSLEQVPAMAAAGINVVRMHLRRFSNSPDGVLPAVEEIARRFEPYRGLVPAT